MKKLLLLTTLLLASSYAGTVQITSPVVVKPVSADFVGQIMAAAGITNVTITATSQDENAITFQTSRDLTTNELAAIQMAIISSLVQVKATP